MLVFFSAKKVLTSSDVGVYGGVGCVVGGCCRLGVRLFFSISLVAGGVRLVLGLWRCSLLFLILVGVDGLDRFSVLFLRVPSSSLLSDLRRFVSEAPCMGSVVSSGWLAPFLYRYPHSWSSCSTVVLCGWCVRSVRTVARCQGWRRPWFWSVWFVPSDSGRFWIVGSFGSSGR